MGIAQGREARLKDTLGTSKSRTAAVAQAQPQRTRIFEKVALSEHFHTICISNMLRLGLRHSRGPVLTGKSCLSFCES